MANDAGVTRLEKRASQRQMRPPIHGRGALLAERNPKARPVLNHFCTIRLDNSRAGPWQGRATRETMQRYAI